MTQPYPFTEPLTPSTRKRLPQRGFVQVGLWEMIAFTPVDGANRKSRDSKWVSKKWKGGVLAVSPVGWAIFLDPSQ